MRVCCCCWNFFDLRIHLKINFHSINKSVSHNFFIIKCSRLLRLFLSFSFFLSFFFVLVRVIYITSSVHCSNNIKTTIRQKRVTESERVKSHTIENTSTPILGNIQVLEFVLVYNTLLIVYFKVFVTGCIWFLLVFLSSLYPPPSNNKN